LANVNVFVGAVRDDFKRSELLKPINNKREGSTAPPKAGRRAWRRARRSAPSVAVAVLLLVLVASVWQPHVGTPSHSSHATGVLPLSPRRTALGHSSTGLAADPASAVAQNASSPTYDEQIATTFADNFTTLAYNVTVLAQTDADGYGPAYLLNGLTAQDYFYQVGISYHWPINPGSWPTFGFIYDVFGPIDTPVYPTTGGAGLENLSANVNSGDSVLLSLTFTGRTVRFTPKD